MKKIGGLIIQNPKSKIKIRDVEKGEFIFFRSGKNTLCHNKKIIDGENIFLSTGGTANVHYFSGDAAYSTDVFCITTDPSVCNTRYLYYKILSMIEVINNDMFKGATIKHLQKDEFKNIEFNIQPLNEQKRIVEKLDTCMEQIEKAIQNVEQNIQNVEELFQSQLNEIFNRNNESYSIEILDNLCNKTSNIKWAEHIDDEFKYVDLSSVDRVNLKIENFNYVNHKNAPSRAKKIVKTNDVIFATTRPTLKRVTRINEDFNNQLCSTGYCVLRPREDLILTDIIYYFIQTDFFMNEMEKIQKGASYPAVSDKEVKNVEISFPKDIEKQVSISFQLNSLNEKIFDLKNSYLSEIIALNELKESILAKAFNGE